MMPAEGGRADRRATFDRPYAQAADPWGFDAGDYERRKRRATLDALADRRFAAGLEIGCSFGVLTERLALARGSAPRPAPARRPARRR